MENIKISSIDNYQLSLNIYNVENPKGYIQVLHGMQEHQNRYKDLALYLNKRGYTVITSDMRSHGENAVELGYFKEKDGYRNRQLVDDHVCCPHCIRRSIRFHSARTTGASQKSYSDLCVGSFSCDGAVSLRYVPH